MEHITSKYWSLEWLLEQSLEKEEIQLPNYKKIQEPESKCLNPMIFIQVYWKYLFLLYLLLKDNIIYLYIIILYDL